MPEDRKKPETLEQRKKRLMDLLHNKDKYPVRAVVSAAEELQRLMIEEVKIREGKKKALAQFWREHEAEEEKKRMFKKRRK